MSTPVSGPLATVPLHVAAGDVAVWWNDPGGTWESVPLGSGATGATGPAGPSGATGAAGPPGTGSISGMTAGQLPIAATPTGIVSSIPTTTFVATAGGVMTGPLSVPAGTATATGFNLGTAGTGIWSSNGATQLNIATGGANRAAISSVSLNMGVPILEAAGTVTAPTYSFSGATTNGMWRSGTNQVSLGTNGIETMRWNADNSTTALGPVLLPADPTLALQAATKQYVDAHPGTPGPTGATGPAGPTGATGAAGSTVASGVSFTPTGNVSATDAQSAIAEVDSEKVAKAGDTMTGPLIIPLGAVAATSLNFGGPGCGMWSTNANNVINFSTSSVLRLTIGGASGVITSVVPYLGPTGTVTAPTFSFSGATTNGFWRSGTNQISIATNGIEAMRWNADQSTTAMGPVSVLADPTTALQLATKQYVDARPGMTGMVAGQIPIAASATTVTSSTATLAASFMPAHTGDVTSPAGSTVNTLPTVNSNVGTFNNVTINAKGLATAGSNVAYVTGGPYLALTGGQLSGSLGIGKAPGVALDVAGGVSCTTSVNAGAGVSAGTGYAARAGTPGPFRSNVFNIDWAPGGVLWVDNVNVGTFAFTCDYRIKTNVAPLGSTWDKVKALKPVSFEYADHPELLTKADPAERWGFLAHELQETLIPSAATGYKDAPNLIQSPDLLAMLASLTRALQEAMVRIEQLEAA